MAHSFFSKITGSRGITVADITTFIRQQWLLLGVLILASFLRLFRIGDYMTFLGDEGRDVLVAKHILEGDFVFIGPRSSAADFFYGPIYFYLITPFLWLFRYDPVGPAVMIALFGIATVYLVYKVGSTVFGKKAGLFAAALYSVSPLVIAYSRSSWNPNPLPLVSLITLFSLYHAVTKKSWKLFALVGLLLGCAMQMQYLALFLVAIVGMYVFLGTILREKRFAALLLIKEYLQIGLGFLIGFAPFLAFEVSHGFPNTRTILQFIFVTNANNPTAQDHPFIQVASDAFLRMSGRLITQFPPPDQFVFYDKNALFYWATATVLLMIVAIVCLYRTKNVQQRVLLVTWLVLGVGLFGFYKKPLYDYYFGFLFPLPFLLVGNAVATVYDTKLFGKILSVGVFGLLMVYNLMGNPFRSEPNKQKQQVENIADFVISKTDNKPFNFALVTEGNSDHAYRYFFEVKNRTPVEIKNLAEDPERNSVTDQLLVVCEYTDCKPLGISLHEVAGFGRAEIAGEWNYSVVKIIKLVHYME